MMCSKTVSIGLEELKKIQKKLEDNKYSTFSEFVQKAIKNELRR